MRVDDILHSKGNDVVTIRPEATVLRAAYLMNERRIGSLVVTGDGGDLIGIISERDILTRVVAQQREPAQTRVETVMSTPVLTCGRFDTLDELRALCHSRRVRHIPVMDDHGLCGLVSLGDLNAAQTRELAATVTLLETFVRG